MNACKYILTDIEGTTSDIRFVKETLFPYAAEHLPQFIRQNDSQEVVKEQLVLAAEDLGCNVDDLDTLIAGLLSWIEADLKKTPLKALQGQIWKAGYLNGNFTGHLYEDAYENLKNWSTGGYTLGVYSSGSVAAQRLLFGYSDFGDLTPLFSDYFDTRVGHKREVGAYQKISQILVDKARIGQAKEVLFLSDVVEELDAAKAASMQTAELRRDGRAGSGRHPCFETFDQLSLHFSINTSSVNIAP